MSDTYAFENGKTLNKEERAADLKKTETYIEYLEKKNEELKYKLDNFNKEAARDEQVQKLERKLETYKHSFTMNEKEWARAQQFIETHIEQKHPVPKEALHGWHHFPSFEYIFSSTGIGDCISIRCKSCGDDYDVTDVDSW